MPLLDTNAIETETPQPSRSRAGKYLSFALGRTEYGISILQVREIIEPIEITEVPGTPSSFLGVMNLRGKIIPVLELRRVLAMQSLEPTPETRIVVVELAAIEVGIVVDEVRAVLDIAEDVIENAPPFGAGVNTDFVLGMAKLDQRVSILIDVDRLPDGVEMDALLNVDRSNLAQ